MITEMPTRVSELSLGDRLRLIRRGRRLTVREFADSIFTSPGSYSVYETTSVVSPQGAKRLAAVIEAVHGVPASWTLGEDAAALPRRDSNLQPADIRPVAAPSVARLIPFVPPRRASTRRVA